jgi:hypothetical protein
MTKYIDIVLTQDGMFCVAPPWVVNEGDLISVPDVLTGKPKIHEVISVATDKTDGDYHKQIEKYIGYPLPKAVAKYMKSDVEWEDEQDDVQN